MNRFRLAMLAGIVACAPAAWADTVELALTDDTWIDGYNPNWSYGDESDFMVTRYGPRQGLVRFDAALLAGQGVSEATLTLYLSSLGRDGTFGVYPITSSWNECCVSWNNQPPAESAPVAEVELTTGDAGGVITIDVTETVQRWAEGSLPDAGFLIKTSDGYRAFFDTKEMTGGTPARLLVMNGASTIGSEAVVLDLSHLAPCRIDEPGHYVLDRGWDGSSPASCLWQSHLSIEADDVLLDLRGHELIANAPADVLRIEGSHVTVRNGKLLTPKIQATGDNNRLERLSVDGRVYLYGSGGHFIDSTTTKEIVLNGENYRLQNLKVDAGGPLLSCIYLGKGARNAIIRGNYCRPGEYGILIPVDGAIVEGNILLHQATGVGIYVWDAIGVKVLRNKLLHEGGHQQGLDAILVLGTGHVIDGNQVRPGAYLRGLRIPGAGNFFGNNRVSATTPYSDTGDDIDWDGNVGY